MTVEDYFEMAGKQKNKKLTVLMLIGKVGNGKSSTANTILGDRLFVSHPNAPAAAKIIKQGVVECSDRIVKVIDTPGFEDIECDEKELVTSEIEKVLMLCSEGIDACLIVLSYDNLMTPKESETIKHIQDYFGEEFKKKHCILLVTNGDKFFGEKTNPTIKQWAETQNKQFKDLYTACGEKIIFFENIKGEANRDGQIKELLKMVDSLGGKMYTDGDFAKAKKDRKAMNVISNRPSIRDDTMTEAGEIIEQLKLIYTERSNDVKEGELTKLEDRAQALLDKVRKEDNKTGILNDLIEHVQTIAVNIDKEISCVKSMK
ncbi:hypothetical protein Btru_048195 [Bulinus truncatus]|nr:hypothetical protein Btru_048195 [Bulinus truncatus]